MSVLFLIQRPNIISLVIIIFVGDNNTGGRVLLSLSLSIQCFTKQKLETFQINNIFLGREPLNKTLIILSAWKRTSYK